MVMSLTRILSFLPITKLAMGRDTHILMLMAIRIHIPIPTQVICQLCKAIHLKAFVLFFCSCTLDLQLLD